MNFPTITTKKDLILYLSPFVHMQEGRVIVMWSHPTAIGVEEAVVSYLKGHVSVVRKYTRYGFSKKESIYWDLTETGQIVFREDMSSAIDFELFLSNFKKDQINGILGKPSILSM